MKISAIVTAAAIFASMSGAAFASCDVNEDDKQALCARACDDTYISRKMNYGAQGQLEQVKAEKKACDEKCGCPQNTAK